MNTDWLISNLIKLPGMGQQGNTQGMVQNQGQGINPQQTPNLVAQLQRQIPNQANMMNQQYSHQPPPY